jgi:hypothetical protein
VAAPTETQARRAPVTVASQRRKPVSSCVWPSPVIWPTKTVTDTQPRRRRAPGPVASPRCTQVSRCVTGPGKYEPKPGTGLIIGSLRLGAAAALVPARSQASRHWQASSSPDDLVASRGLKSDLDTHSARRSTQPHWLPVAAMPGHAPLRGWHSCPV